MVMLYPNIPTGDTGFLNRKIETTTATAPFAFPSTCNVSGLVHFVTRKFVRLTLNAKTQFRVLLRYGKQSVSRDRDLYYVMTGGQSANREEKSGRTIVSSGARIVLARLV